MKFLCDGIMMSDDDEAFFAIFKDDIGEKYTPFEMFYSVDRDEYYVIAKSLESLYYDFHADRECVIYCDICNRKLTNEERGHGCDDFLQIPFDIDLMIKILSPEFPEVGVNGFTRAYYSNPGVRRMFDGMFKCHWKPVLCNECKLTNKQTFM